MNAGLARACIEVVDWSDCALDGTAAARTGVASLIGQALPFDAVAQNYEVRGIAAPSGGNVSLFAWVE